MEHGIEHGPGNGGGVPGIGPTGGTGQPHPVTGGPDDHHVAEVRTGRRRESEVGEHLEAAGPDEISARLVAGELGFVHHRHPGPAPGEHEGGDTARWTAADDEDVKARPLHHPRATSHPPDRSDLQ